MSDKPSINTIRDKAIELNVPFKWALEKKKKYIASMLAKIKQNINERKRLNDELGLKEKTIQSYQKQFNSYQTYLRYLNNPETDTKAITDDEIEIARNYPIHEFLPDEYTGKGNINCLLPGHEDKNASMQTTNNFLWCHTCNKKMDSLDLAMMFHGIDFKSAVKLLARS